MEVIGDWHIDQPMFGHDHYDGRDYISCQQNGWKQKVITERGAEPEPASKIEYMDDVVMCKRADWRFGARVNCAYFRGTTPATPLPARDPRTTNKSDYWVWRTNPNRFHLFDVDPP